jgi:hypothetical protein
MSEPIKLPPDVVTSRLVMEGINKHVGRDIEQWVNEQLRLAVEQATAELRAEVERLRFALTRISGRCDTEAAYKIARTALARKETTCPATR